MYGCTCNNNWLSLEQYVNAHTNDIKIMTRLLYTLTHLQRYFNGVNDSMYVPNTQVDIEHIDIKLEPPIDYIKLKHDGSVLIDKRCLRVCFFLKSSVLLPQFYRHWWPPYRLKLGWVVAAIVYQCLWLGAQLQYKNIETFVNNWDYFLLPFLLLLYPNYNIKILKHLGPIS
jgi:hypothetical protein